MDVKTRKMGLLWALVDRYSTVYQAWGRFEPSMMTLQVIERRRTTEPAVEFAGETRAIGLGLGRSLVLSVVG
jgi:hypothetical protein